MDNPETLSSLGTQDTGQINLRENREGNQKWTIQRNYGTPDEEKQSKITKQYVLDTTIHK